MGFRLQFPTTITHLDIYTDVVWNSSSLRLPPNLTHLIMEEDHFHKIAGPLPATLVEVSCASSIHTNTSYLVLPHF